MTSRPSGGEGQIGRIMRRLGTVTRFNRLGQPAPSRTLQQQPTQGAPQPRPPAQGPAAPRQAPTDQPPAGQVSGFAEGQEITVPGPGEGPPGGQLPGPVAPAPGGQLLGDIQESPAVQYWREHGMMPNWFSTQVMATRRKLEAQLGRRPSGREIAQELSRRDMSADSSNTPTI